MRAALLSLTLVFAPVASAQQTGEIAKYSIHSAAYSTLLTYCTTKYGPAYGDSPGGQCFTRGQKQLGRMDLAVLSRALESKCPNVTTFSTCMTPHIASTILGIIALFEANGV